MTSQAPHISETEPRWEGLREVVTMAWPIVLGSLSFVLMDFVDKVFVGDPSHQIVAEQAAPQITSAPITLAAGGGA